jgi:hypothetical protein
MEDPLTKALRENPAWRDAIVCENMKVVYLPLAKVNCTGLKRLFMRLDKDPRWDSDFRTLHDCEKNFLRNKSKEKQLEILFNPNWVIFAVIREPFTRFKSCFLDKCGPNGDVDVYKGLSAEEFVDKVCSGTIRENHSMTQTDCLGYPAMLSYIDMFGTLETLSQDLDSLCSAAKFNPEKFKMILQSGWGKDKQQPFLKVRAQHATDSTKKTEVFTESQRKRILQFLKPDYLNFTYAIPDTLWDA